MITTVAAGAQRAQGGGDFLRQGVAVRGRLGQQAPQENPTTAQGAAPIPEMRQPPPATSQLETPAPAAPKKSPFALSSPGASVNQAIASVANGHTGTISDSNWSSQAVRLDGGSGDGFVSDTSSATAAPSSLSSDGSSFSVSYGSGGGQTTTTGDPSAAGSGYPGSGYGYGDGSGYGYGDGSGYGYGDGGATIVVPYGYGDGVFIG